MAESNVDFYGQLSATHPGFRECRKRLRRGELDAGFALAQEWLLREGQQDCPYTFWCFRIVAAQFLTGLGRFAEGLALFDRSLPPDCALNGLQTWTKTVQGYLECHLGHFETAETVLHDAYDEATTHGHELLLGEIQARRGTLAFRRNKWPLSRERFCDAKDIGTRYGDQYLELCGMMGIAKTVRETAGHRNAIPLFHEGLSIALKSGFKVLAGKIAGEIGNSYSFLDDLDEAERYSMSALATCAEIGQLGDCHIINANLGNMWVRRGRIDKAIQHYLDALRLAKQIHDSWSAMRWTGNLALAHFKLHEYPSAAKYVAEACRTARILGDAERLSSYLALSAQISSQGVRL
jgi:tetratricopeptide (TPR) repeat protein